MQKHASEEDVEVVDLYQILCFLLDLPPSEHSGRWDRVRGMLTVSGSERTAAAAATVFTAAALILLSHQKMVLPLL